MVKDEEIQQQIRAVGARLAEARKERGLDQQELSQVSGVSRVMISDFERAARTMSIEHLFRLAEGAGIQPGWLISGEGEMLTEGLTLRHVWDEAWQGRVQEYHFLAVVDQMLRRYRTNKKHMTWALGSCLRAFWGASWLGFDDLREVSKSVETVSDRCGLDLIEVLESTGHLNASQYIADWYPHRGIDPNAFYSEMTADASGYDVHYDRQNAESSETLLRKAREKSVPRSASEVTPTEHVVNFFLGFIKIFNPRRLKD